MVALHRDRVRAVPARPKAALQEQLLEWMTLRIGPVLQATELAAGEQSDGCRGKAAAQPDGLLASRIGRRHQISVLPAPSILGREIRPVAHDSLHRTVV